MAGCLHHSRYSVLSGSGIHDKVRAPRAQKAVLPLKAVQRIARAHAASSATEAAPKRPGEKKGDGSLQPAYLTLLVTTETVILKTSICLGCLKVLQAILAGFVEEMRFVAMKLHTKDQAPKEGGKEASQHPMKQVPHFYQHHAVCVAQQAPPLLPQSYVKFSRADASANLDYDPWIMTPMSMQLCEDLGFELRANPPLWPSSSPGPLRFGVCVGGGGICLTR